MIVIRWWLTSARISVPISAECGTPQNSHLYFQIPVVFMKALSSLHQLVDLLDQGMQLPYFPLKFQICSLQAFFCVIISPFPFIYHNKLLTFFNSLSFSIFQRVKLIQSVWGMVQGLSWEDEDLGLDLSLPQQWRPDSVRCVGQGESLVQDCDPIFETFIWVHLIIFLWRGMFRQWQLVSHLKSKAWRTIYTRKMGLFFPINFHWCTLER